MKKYRQVLVFIITVLSICGLFFYRSAYTKLRSTIETLNLFNGPSERQDCLVLNQTADGSKVINMFSFPSPEWIQVGEFYVYSAFWKIDGEKSHSKAIGVGLTEVIVSEHDCHVWYKLQDRLFSVSGNFWYISKRIRNSSVYTYEMYCGVNSFEVKGKPYMFVIIDKNKNKKYFVPIYYESNKSDQYAAMCVLPDVLGIEMVSIAEFISFHQIIGITDFLIYDLGIHYGLLNKLQSVFKVMNSLRSFSVFSWHFPYDDVAAFEESVKLDCMYRTSDQVKFLIFLKWNEYLILRENRTISDTFNRFSDFNNFEVNIKFRKCCLEMKNDKQSEKSWPLLLKKTQCFQENKLASMMISVSDVSSHNTLNVSTSVASVNSYTTCDNVKLPPTFHDPGASKFLVDLMTSKLLRIWRSGTLFDD